MINKHIDALNLFYALDQFYSSTPPLERGQNISQFPTKQTKQRKRRSRGSQALSKICHGPRELFIFVKKMAWIAIGSSNEDLCDKLINLNVLKSEDIVRAFRLTDRGDFVDQKYR